MRFFGIIGYNDSNQADLKKTSKFAARRGQDSSGIMMHTHRYKINRADYSIEKLISKTKSTNVNLFLESEG